MKNKEDTVLNNRRQIAMCHGFRKFFDTTCTNSGMNQTYVDFCLGHKLPGVKDSYFLPQPDANGVYMDILEGHGGKSPGYLDAIDYLTINEENSLKRQVETLTIKKSEIDQLRQQAQAENSIIKEMQDQIRSLGEDLTAEQHKVKEMEPHHLAMEGLEKKMEELNKKLGLE